FDEITFSYYVLNEPSSINIYTLSLHDALPIFAQCIEGEYFFLWHGCCKTLAANHAPPASCEPRWGDPTSWGASDETHHGDYQAVQARGRAAGGRRSRRSGHDSHRGQGLRAAERAYGALSGCRVLGRLRAEDEGRGR